MAETTIHVCDNGFQDQLTDHDNVIVHRQERNLGVAGSWNFLAELIFKDVDYALILNDDIIIHKDFRQICSFIETNPVDFAFAGYGCSSFILPKATFEIVGPFDEHFYPAYFEDCDFERRVLLAGLRNLRTDFLSAEVFRNSSSIQKDPALNKDFDRNRQYYLNKWGGLPYQEVYLTPFGNG